MLYAHFTTHIAPLTSFIARCCLRSPAAQAFTGVFRFTRAYDEEGGTEDTTARRHRQHNQLLPRHQWPSERGGMGSSDGGSGESQYQDESEWCKEDRCRLYEAKEGWRSRDQDFGLSEAQTEVRASDRPYNRCRQEDDGNSGRELWKTFLPEVVRQDAGRGHGVQPRHSPKVVQGPGYQEVQALDPAEAHAAPLHQPTRVGVGRSREGRSLTNSYRGCLETGGDNTYKTHRGLRKNARSGVEDFAVAKSVVDKARQTLAQLKAAQGAFERFSGESTSEEEEEKSGSEGE